MRISDWSSDVCSSDLGPARPRPGERDAQRRLAAGARGRRGGTAQQLLALAAVLLQPRPGSAQVVHPTDVRAAHRERVDRKSGVKAKRVYGRVEFGGRLFNNKKNKYT